MNLKLFIAIAVFLALAVFGAAVFSGYIKDDSAAPDGIESPAEQTNAEPAVEEQTTQTDDAAVEEAPPSEETAAMSGGAGFDLNAALGTRALGNPNAPVKIIEYMSLTCNHCAHFHKDVLPDLKAKYIDTGKIYLEFQEFPLNAPALDASLLARCLPAERYESFIGLLFKTQEDWTVRPDYITALKQNAKLAGLSDEGAEQCLKSNELRQAIGERIQKASEQYKIASTPTFVFNGGADFIRGAMPVEEFERVMAKLSGEAPSVAPEAEAPAGGEPPAADADAQGPEESPGAPEAVPMEEPVQQ